jgi:hypothetical protein
VCEGARAALGGSQRCRHVGRWRIAKDEEFDEGPNENNDRELPEKQTLREGETLRTSVSCVILGLGGLDLRRFSLGDWHICSSSGHL